MSEKSFNAEGKIGNDGLSGTKMIMSSTGAAHEDADVQTALNGTHVKQRREKHRKGKRKGKSCNGVQPRHICDLCGNTFGNIYSLQLHMKIHLEEKSYICEFCGRSFRRSHHLKQHELAHQGNLRKQFNCSVCGNTFVEKRGLKNHMAMHIGKKEHTCEICGKCFWHKDGVRNHIYTVHNPAYKVKAIGQRSGECKLCGKTFSRTSDLIQHRYIHTGEKQASCSICKKEFTRKFSLNRHMARKHNPLKVKKKRVRKLKKNNIDTTFKINETGTTKSDGNKNAPPQDPKITTEPVSALSTISNRSDVYDTQIGIQSAPDSSSENHTPPIQPDQIKQELEDTLTEPVKPFRYTLSFQCDQPDRYNCLADVPLIGSEVKVAVRFGDGVFPSVQVKNECGSCAAEDTDEELQPM